MSTLTIGNVTPRSDSPIRRRMAGEVIIITAAQARAARAMLRWSMSEAAQKAGVAIGTLNDFEKGKRKPNRSTLAAIQRCYEAAGLIFTNGREPGVKMKAPG
jgi:DNA-binding XRE family transcriptional regulator